MKVMHCPTSEPVANPAAGATGWAYGDWAYEGGTGSHRDHRTEVADHADVRDTRFGVKRAVVEGALDPVREAGLLAEDIADQALEQLQILRGRPPAVA